MCSCSYLFGQPEKDPALMESLGLRVPDNDVEAQIALMGYMTKVMVGAVLTCGECMLRSG